MSRQLTPEHRAAISRGQLNHHAQVREHRKAEPTLKRCSKCGAWKNRARDFHWRPIKRGGREYLYPRAECKLCAAKKSAAYRAMLKATGRFQSAQKRWERNRRKHVRETTPRVLDAVQVAEYFDRFLKVDEFSESGTNAQFFRYRLNGVAMTDLDTHRLNRWRKGTPKRLTERQVDEISIRYDLPPWEAIEAGKMAA